MNEDEQLEEIVVDMVETKKELLPENVVEVLNGLPLLEQYEWLKDNDAESLKAKPAGEKKPERKRMPVMPKRVSPQKWAEMKRKHRRKGTGKPQKRYVHHIF